MYINIGGSWIEPLDVQVKHADAWKTATVYARLGGAWRVTHQGVPANMYVIYPSAADVVSSRMGTPVTALYGRFPRGTALSAEIGTTYSAAHDGAEHGSASATTSEHYNAVDTENYSDHVPYWKHTHSIPAHAHSGVVNIDPPYKNVCPCLGADQIRNGALFLSKGAPTAALVAYAAALGKYLRFAADGSTGGSSTHTHSWSGDTGSSNWTSNSGIDEIYPNVSMSFNPFAHAHPAGHSLAAASNLPPLRKLRVLQWAGGTTGSIHNFPSGTIAFFSTAALPLGWSRYSGLDDYLPYGADSDVEAVGGATTHTHAAQGCSTGVSPSIIKTNYAATMTLIPALNHTHTWTDSHPAAGSSWPSWVKLYVGVKN